MRVVTTEDPPTEVGIKRVTKDEGVFRALPKDVEEIPKDTNFNNLDSNNNMKESSIQDALEIWAREQTFSFTAEIEVERDNGVDESCVTKVNSPRVTSSRFKCVINHPLALTPLCGQRNHWDDDTCDLMPLPFDYGPKAAADASIQANSGIVNVFDDPTLMITEQPLNYCADPELYLFPTDAQNQYLQSFFPKEASLFRNDTGYYGSLLTSELKDSDGVIKGDQTSSMFMTFV